MQAHLTNGYRRRGCLLALSGLLAPMLQARAHVDVGSRSVQVTRPKLERLPPITLTDLDGKPQRLDRALAGNDPLVLSFIFTTCSSSCSVLSAIMADVQRRFVARQRGLLLASITIDPDNDTPAQLRRYAKKFEAGPAWHYYTGRFDDLLDVQRHFDVYRGSKVSHPPVLLMRRNDRAPWVRIEGFPTAAGLVALIDTLPA